MYNIQVHVPYEKQQYINKMNHYITTTTTTTIHTHTLSLSHTHTNTHTHTQTKNKYSNNNSTFTERASHRLEKTRCKSKHTCKTHQQKTQPLWNVFSNVSELEHAQLDR